MNDFAGVLLSFASAIAYSPLGMKTGKRGVSLAPTCRFASYDLQGRDRDR
ncbi:MAG: hypothetical protein AB1861_06760 [Cyanobacteriota bacterium]